MKAVRERIEKRKAEIAAHPFYDWVRASDAPLSQRFDFAPALVNFIMGFADMNRWFMRYENPADEYQRAINHHTLEDEQHSGLFVEDWRKLGLDERLGWTAGDLLAWYHAAPETESLRRDAQWMTRMFVENEDPLVRFALMESIESWGHVMFGATAPSASRLGRETGEDYRYFGPYHLDRELGSLIDGDDLFDDVVLDAGRRERSLALVDGLFDLAERESDELLRFVRRHADGGLPAAPTAPAAPTGPAVVPAPAGPVDGGSRSVVDIPRQATSAPARSAGTARVEDVLDACRRAAAAHPLLAWMAADGDPRDKLRRIALFWAPDCLGYRDLSLHVLSYPAPADAAQRAVNRWTGDLGTHHRLFLDDWAALGMDEYLGLCASDTLDLYCRSDRSEAQRESAAAFVTLAHRHPDPVSRFWLVTALQASGEAFFAATRALALRVEQEHGVRLDYLADRHEASHRPGPADPEADAVDFRAVELTPGAEEIAVATIRTVFDRLEAQMTASLEQVGSTSASVR